MSCLPPCAAAAAAAAGPAAAALARAVAALCAAQCLLSEPWVPDARHRVSDGATFDYIVVGAGSAGALLAARLPGPLLLLEAGGDPPLESIIPNYSGSLHRGEHAWVYHTEADGATHRGGRGGRSFWPRGRALGGTGAINGLLHMRGSRQDYAPWHHQPQDGWDWNTIEECFKKSENVIDPLIRNNPDLLRHHGTQGEYKIDELKFLHTDLVNNLTKAYVEMGLDYLDDLNGPTQMGVGRIRGANINGRRVSSATAFLNPVGDRKDLYVLKHAVVNRVIIDDELRAKGVEVAMDGKIVSFFADKEVILSAGSVNTPKLLMLSGIGPRAHLEAMNIKVLADLPVGKNLQDHVRIPIPVTLDSGAESLNESYWQKAAIDYFLDQTGPHATNYDQPNINAFMSTPAKKEQPDVQIDHNYFLPNTSYVFSMCTDIMSYEDGICEQLSKFNSKKELILFYISLCRPHSRGEILLRSNRPDDDPMIYSKYFSDHRDMGTFVENIKSVMKIVDTPAMKSVNAKLMRIHHKDCDVLTFADDDYWECMARTLTYNVYHPVGTAKMGPLEDPSSVVDHRLRVHGVKGLRVVDASVMPTIPSVNTNAPTMMIAERAADIIKTAPKG